MSERRLFERVALGATVLLLVSIATRLVRLVGTVVLARLLLPEHYGLIALAMVAVGLGEVLTDFRVGSALVRRERIDAGALNAAFTLTAARGAALSIALAGVAFPLERFFETPGLGLVLLWLSIGPFVDGLRNPALAVREKELDYRPEAWLSTAGATATTLLTVLGAWWLRDERALVFGQLGGRAFSTAASYLVVPMRPRLSWQGVPELLGFGGWLTAGGVLSYVNMKLDVLVLGETASASVLGAYAVGQEVASTATAQVSAPLSRVLYPGLVESSRDPTRLRAAFLNAQQAIAAVALPIGIGTSLVAPELVRVAAGAKWADAIPVVQWLAPVMAIHLVSSGTQSLAMALGRTDALFRTQLAAFLSRAPLIIAGALWHGLLGVVYARTIAGLLLGLLNALLAARLLGITMWRPYAQAWRSFVSVAAMTLAVVVAEKTLPRLLGRESRDLEQLVAMALTGVLSYAIIHWWCWRLAGSPQQSIERRVFTLCARLRERWRARAQAT